MMISGSFKEIAWVLSKKVKMEDGTLPFGRLISARAEIYLIGTRIGFSLTRLSLGICKFCAGK